MEFTLDNIEFTLNNMEFNLGNTTPVLQVQLFELNVFSRICMHFQ